MNPFKQTSLKIRGSILLLALIITGGYILYDLHFKPPIAYALKDINVYSQPSISSEIEYSATFSKAKFAPVSFE